MAKLILVTGGAGFVGSHLCRRLADDGHHVISLDNYFAGSRDNHVAAKAFCTAECSPGGLPCKTHRGVEYREGHTKDIERLVPETPDLIYHLGEYARVEQSMLEPDVVHDLNVFGTSAVVDFWLARKCKLVYAGSSTKFGDGGSFSAKTPYSESKAANTELVKREGDKAGLPYAITYFYNVYGPGERGGTYGTVIEAFKQMYRRGTPISVVAPGTQTRNFTHVDDIVEGLVMVGEKGQGDEYGLGNERAFTMLEVAQLFGGEIVMLPERAGNRMSSDLDPRKAHELGLHPQKSLEDYISAFVSLHARGKAIEKRVLVFSTTFYPIVGPAERALLDLIKKMPDVEFDIVTTVFSPEARAVESPEPNAHLYRVGFGHWSDKFLLPFLGFAKARTLHRAHSYLFTWALMASYAALVGVFLRRATGVPLLITLADQNIANLSPLRRAILKMILTDSDQVYGGGTQEQYASRMVAGKNLRRSLGEGDAFANQLRYAYAEILLNQKSV